MDHGDIQEKWLAQKFSEEKIVRDIRIDGVAIFLVLALSAFCFGKHWMVLLGLLMVRTFFISFMDNVYHYRTPLHATVSGHNLSLPRGFSRFLLNFNFHRVHHRNPSVPWTQLPELFAEHSDRFDRNLFTAALNQLRGPVPLSDLGHKALARS